VVLGGAGELPRRVIGQIDETNPIVEFGFQFVMDGLRKICGKAGWGW
jgi:hypothetical protein